MKEILTRVHETWNRNRSFLLRCLLLAAALILLTESAFRFSIAEGLKLLYRHPADFAVGVLALTGAASFLAFLTNCPRLSLSLVFFLYTLLSAANMGLRIFRSTPITPRDLLLAKEVLAIGSELFSPKLLLVFAAFLLLILAVFFAVSWVSRDFVKGRLLSACASRMILPVTLLIAMAIGVQQRYNNTFLVRFFAGSGQFFAGAYTESFHELLSSSKSILPTYPIPDGKKPNILIIQSEAFWDPTRIGKVFNRDPIPNFRRIRERTIHGDMLVPVFGGGTCNTEYEILTGGSVRAYTGDPWYLIFPNEIKTPIQSAATILRAQGYRTYANHPFMNWFFNRREVYRHLGFHEFRTLEYMRDAIRYYDIYVPDAYFTTELVRQIRETNEPVLSIAVTMQNHGPYEYDRFGVDKPDVYVNPGELESDSARFFLTNYAQGVALSDAELPVLLKQLEEIDEPTMVLFYGDHLPMLGTNYLAFREGKYISTLAEEGSEDLFRLKTVPFFLWSNFDMRSRDLGTLNSYYMLPLMLRYGGLELPDNMIALEEAASRFPTFDGVHLTDSMGIVYEQGSYEFEQYQGFLGKYRDMLLGKSDEARILLPVDGTGANAPYNPEYNAELNEIRIDSVSPNEIRGHNLYQDLIVLVDGEPVEAEFPNRTTIRFTKPIPSEARTVRLELRDSNNDLLTTSPEFQIR